MLMLCLCYVHPKHRFGRGKWCIKAAKPKDFIISSLQNVTVRHFLAFWGLFVLKGVCKTHGIYVGSRFRGTKKTCFYDFWASWRLLGRFGALLGPLLGLIFYFGLVKTEELATGGFKLLGLAEKVLHKCSQTEEFHHFFITKRQSRTRTIFTNPMLCLCLCYVYAMFIQNWCLLEPPGASWNSFWASSGPAEHAFH